MNYIYEITNLNLPSVQRIQLIYPQNNKQFSLFFKCLLPQFPTESLIYSSRTDLENIFLTQAPKHKQRRVHTTRTAKRYFRHCSEHAETFKLEKIQKHHRTTMQ